jgi:hypothetical protein
MMIDCHGLPLMTSDDLPHQVQLVRMGVGSFLNRHGARAFGGWKALCLTKRASERLRSLMTRVIRQLSSRHLARGCAAWIAYHEMRTLKLKAIQRSLSHFRHRPLHKGWNAWVESASALKASMQTVSEVALELMNDCYWWPLMTSDDLPH